jgi:hypothetical protein
MPLPPRVPSPAEPCAPTLAQPSQTRLPPLGPKPPSLSWGADHRSSRRAGNDPLFISLPLYVRPIYLPISACVFPLGIFLQLLLAACVFPLGWGSCRLVRSEAGAYLTPVLGVRYCAVSIGACRAQSITPFARSQPRLASTGHPVALLSAASNGGGRSRPMGRSWWRVRVISPGF